MNIDRTEGRQFAVGVVLSVIGMPQAFFGPGGSVNTVLANLEQTAKAKPEQYAEGIRDVVRECRL